MKDTIIGAVKILIVVFIFSYSFIGADKCFSDTIDVFIGQLNIKKPFRVIEIRNDHKRAPYFMYHGDRVVIKRDNKTGESFVEGVYVTILDPNIYPGNDGECIIPIERIRVRNFTLNVNINDVDIKTCF